MKKKESPKTEFKKKSAVVVCGLKGNHNKTKLQHMRNGKVGNLKGGRSRNPQTNSQLKTGLKQISQTLL